MKQYTQQPLVHGGDWAGYAQEHGGAQPLDFSANVSPLGVPKGVQRAICAAAGRADRYPDPLCRELQRAVARAAGTRPEYCLCGAGAADLIFRAAFARRPRRALVTAPTFAEYEAAVTAAGGAVERHVLSERQNFRLDASFLEKITPGLDLVFLCEPNNPTGLVSAPELLRQVLNRCALTGALLVVDECFADFLPDFASRTLAPELAQHPNLLLLRAFTKLYAMAGVRLGYALCADTAFLARMRAAGPPWAVSGLAQEAGLAALGEAQYAARVRALAAQERPWLRSQLQALGLRVVPGEANYLLFQCGTPLGDALRARGILLRSCKNYIGLDDTWYRTAVRTHADNQRLVAALREVLA